MTFQHGCRGQGGGIKEDTFRDGKQKFQVIIRIHMNEWPPAPLRNALPCSTARVSSSAHSRCHHCYPLSLAPSLVSATVAFCLFPQFSPAWPSFDHPPAWAWSGVWVPSCHDDLVAGTLTATLGNAILTSTAHASEMDLITSYCCSVQGKPSITYRMRARTLKNLHGPSSPPTS